MDYSDSQGGSDFSDDEEKQSESQDFGSSNSY